MFEWLAVPETAGFEVPPIAIAGRLGLSAIAGLVIAAISHRAYGHRQRDTHGLTTTLVLLTVLLAMVTLVIGNSVARAFGLVGALSIVRFRTVVNDTRDTAFVIFAVIVGMAVGAGVWLVPALGMPLIAALAIGLGRRQFGLAAIPGTHALTVKLGLGRDFEPLLRPVFDQYLTEWKLISAATSRQGAAIEAVFSVALRDPALSLQLPRLIADVNRLEGVQSVGIAELGD